MRHKVIMAVGVIMLAGVVQLAAQQGGRRGGGAGGGDDADFMKADPIAQDDAEKKILDVLDDMFENQRRGNMNVPPEDGRFLRILAEMSDAKHVVEIGTSNGYSGIWLCLALRTTGGKLTTFEIDADRAKLARENFARAGVEDMVTLVEGDAHEEVTEIEDEIDILFLDADKEGYIDYLNKLVPRVRPGGIIIAHNMNPRMADSKFVEAITTNSELDSILVNTSPTGFSLSLKKRD